MAFLAPVVNSLCRRWLVGIRGMRDDLDPSLFHPTRCQDFACDGTKLARQPTHHDHFETQIVGKVDMKRCAHSFAQFVLKLREAFGEVAHMMVVHDGQRCDGFDAPFYF